MKKKSNLYRDALHNLVKPILTTTPTDPAKRKKTATELRKSARQEVAWSESAFREGRCEKARALKLPKGDPFRRELLDDSSIAYSFGHIRIERAHTLSHLANNLSKSLRGNK